MATTDVLSWTAHVRTHIRSQVSEDTISTHQWCDVPRAWWVKVKWLMKTWPRHLTVTRTHTHTLCLCMSECVWAGVAWFMWKWIEHVGCIALIQSTQLLPLSPTNDRNFRSDHYSSEQNCFLSVFNMRLKQWSTTHHYTTACLNVGCWCRLFVCLDSGIRYAMSVHSLHKTSRTMLLVWLSPFNKANIVARKVNKRMPVTISSSGRCFFMFCVKPFVG